jgi:ribonuclease HI
VCNSSIRSSCLAPVAVEAMAVLLAIQLCCELGFLRVHLEGDAKGVIDAVNYVDVDKC